MKRILVFCLIYIHRVGFFLKGKRNIEFAFLLVTDRVLPEIGFSGKRNQLKNGFKASWTRLFFILCQIFALFDDFPKWYTLAKLWKIIKYAKNLVKNEKKSLVQLALNPFFSWFRAPDPSLVTRIFWHRVWFKKKLSCQYS